MAMLFVLLVPKSFAAGPQMWIYIHHEAQGASDESFTKCMPDDAWNGHDDHVGDTKSDESWPSKKECEDAQNPVVPEFGALTGAIAFLTSGGAFYFLKKKD